MAKVPLKKEAIEQAAIELFACKGLSGTTIKDIAQKAGVTEGALYRHYSGKEQMARILFTEELAVLREELLHCLNQNTGVQAKLRAVIEALYRSYQEAPYPLLFVILNFQNLQGSAELDGKEHIYDFIIYETQRLLAEVPSVTEEQGHAFLSTLITGVILQPILFHHYQKLPRAPLAYVDEVSAACCRLIGLDNTEYYAV